MSSHDIDSSHAPNQPRSEDTRGRSGSGRQYHMPSDDALHYLHPMMSMGQPTIGMPSTSNGGHSSSMRGSRESGGGYSMPGSSVPEHGYTQGSRTTVSPPPPSSNLSGGDVAVFQPLGSARVGGLLDGGSDGSVIGQQFIRSSRSPTRAIHSPGRRNAPTSPVTPQMLLHGHTTAAYAGMVPVGDYSPSLKQSTVLTGMLPTSHVVGAHAGHCKRRLNGSMETVNDPKLNYAGSYVLRSNMEHDRADSRNKREKVDYSDAVASDGLSIDNGSDAFTRNNSSILNDDGCGKKDVDKNIGGAGNKSIHGLNSTVSSPGTRQWNELAARNMMGCGNGTFENRNGMNGGDGTHALNDGGRDEMYCTGVRGQQNDVHRDEAMLNGEVNSEGSERNVMRDNKSSDKSSGMHY